MALINFTTLKNTKGNFNFRKAKTFKEVKKQTKQGILERLYRSCSGTWILCVWEHEPVSYYDEPIPHPHKEITPEEAEVWLKRNNYTKPISEIIQELDAEYQEKLKSRKRIPRRRGQKKDR